jgi:hypothetical protein
MNRGDDTAGGPVRADRRASNPVMKLGLIGRMQEGIKQVAGKTSHLYSHSQVISSSVPEGEEDEDEDEDDVEESMLGNTRHRHRTAV